MQLLHFLEFLFVVGAARDEAPRAVSTIKMLLA